MFWTCISLLITISQAALTLQGRRSSGTSSSSADQCFILLDKPVESALVSTKATDLMLKHFLANLNVNGTGAVVASPGPIPALPEGCCPGGYNYHWMRDGGLSMMALQRLVETDSKEDPGVPQDVVSDHMLAYINWVRAVQEQTDYDAHTEPKWSIDTVTPYTGGWCRPQTDGPGLRALALIKFAEQLVDDREQQQSIWELIRFDLDWLAKGVSTIHLLSCDLWEETMDGNFLWNRMTMRAALLKGSDFAKTMDDADTSSAYLQAAEQYIGDPFEDHLQSSQGLAWISECPATDFPSDSCIQYNKTVDGAVILSLVHSGWLAGPSKSKSQLSPVNLPTSSSVADTVNVYNAMFCETYQVNRNDFDNNVPGILYGRYAKDQYGGGNPWVLITASLASLMYQAAQVVSGGTPLIAKEISAWQRAFNSESFGGSADEFVAAGDSVMLRIFHHVAPDDEWHLFEQIDKTTGAQYNAKDLTWSYAEVLSALRERGTALATLRDISKAESLIEI